MQRRTLSSLGWNSIFEMTQKCGITQAIALKVVICAAVLPVGGCCLTRVTPTTRTQVAFFAETQSSPDGEIQKPSVEFVKSAGIAASAWCKSAFVALGIAAPGIVDTIRGTTDNITTTTVGGR
jgi:hypothetical protein